MKITNDKLQPFLAGVFTVCLITFILLSLYVVTEPPQFLDIHISKEIQENQNGLVNNIMIAISWFGRTTVSVIMVILLSLFLILQKHINEALLMISTLFSGIIGLALKMLINRPRPTKDIVVLLEDTKYQSFPSGHVLFYTVFFGSLILIVLTANIFSNKTKMMLTMACLAMIFFGAVSRVYLGAHWFTDVLGGFILGIMFLFITGYYYLNSLDTINYKIKS
jgi:membrane-associated phospholipid phosphatase